MSVIVVGHVYRDQNARDPLPTPLGPFSDRQEAEDWMHTVGPLWGSWYTQRLTEPTEEVAQARTDTQHD